MIDNEAWFDRRLLTTGKFDNIYVGVKPIAYSNAIAKAHRNNNWSTNHTGHLGRALGAKKLERLEVLAVSEVLFVCFCLHYVLTQLYCLLFGF